MIKRLRQHRISYRHLIVIGLVVLVLYVAVAVLGVIARNYQLQQQVDELQAENEIMRLENQQLEYELAYYRTESFVEKEARAKLGLRLPGEHVVAFPDRVPDSYQPPEPEPEPELGEKLTDNVRQWLYFLFRVEI